MTATGAKWSPAPRRSRRNGLRPALPLAIAAVLALLLVGTGAMAWRLARAAPFDMAIAAELDRAAAPEPIRAFYRLRAYDPIWFEPARTPLAPRWALRGEAAQFAQLTEQSRPAETERLRAMIAKASDGDIAAKAEAEVALSRALAVYAARRAEAVTPAHLAFVDPALPAPGDAGATLEMAAEAPSLTLFLQQLRDGNPIYRGLREGLALYRREWSALPQFAVPPGPALGFGATGERVRLLRRRLGLADGDRFDEALEQRLIRFQAVHGLKPTRQADGATIQALNRGADFYEALIRANLERARVLPPDLGARFVLVNIPAAEVAYYAGAERVGTMRAAVGKLDDPTPSMAGVIREVVFNPYWNIPVDLVRESVAPRVLRHGVRTVEAEGLEVLSDWSDEATPLDPSGVDWVAAAAGRAELRVRQKPGPANMMGAMKFMLPNELGIYLHDTPQKGAFESGSRLISAGCVRLEHAAELARWLLGPRSFPEQAGLEQAVTLDVPTPVYILYLTASPAPGGVVFHPDVYGLDDSLLSALAAAQ